MTCPDCNGTRPFFGPCTTCGGTGEVDDQFPERREIGLFLWRKRRALGVTLNKASKLLDIPIVTLSQVERGAVSASITLYNELAE